MKVTIIHGQNHKQNSYHIGSLFLKELGDNLEISEYFLPRDLNTFCLGCYQCITKSIDSCPHYENIKFIKQSMEEAELLVFTTPVYCLHASAPMKSLLDHCFQYYMVHQPVESMFYKKAVIITTGAGSGMKKAAKDIKDSLVYWGISHIYIYSISTQSMTWNDVNQERKEKILKAIRLFAKKVKRDKIKVSLKTRGIFYMMRMMQLKNWGIPQDKEYWKQKGWLDKKRPWDI